MTKLPVVYGFSRLLNKGFEWNKKSVAFEELYGDYNDDGEEIFRKVVLWRPDGSIMVDAEVQNLPEERKLPQKSHGPGYFGRSDIYEWHGRFVEYREDGTVLRDIQTFNNCVHHDD